MVERAACTNTPRLLDSCDAAWPALFEPLQMLVVRDGDVTFVVRFV